VYVFGSGQRYEGHWEKGKKHGWSIYTVETGETMMPSSSARARGVEQQFAAIVAHPHCWGLVPLQLYF
jgi:hypothetical protein